MNRGVGGVDDESESESDNVSDDEGSQGCASEEASDAGGSRRGQGSDHGSRTSGSAPRSVAHMSRAPPGAAGSTVKACGGSAAAPAAGEGGGVKRAGSDASRGRRGRGAGRGAR